MLCQKNFENCIEEIENLGYFERFFYLATNNKFMKICPVIAKIFLKYLGGFLHFYYFLVKGGGQLNIGVEETTPQSSLPPGTPDF